MPLDQLHEQDRLKQEKGEMSFFEHIEELRKHILRSVAAIVVVGIVCFINKDFIFNTLIFGPRNPDFFSYQVLCNASHWMGLGDKMCVQPVKFQIITRQLGEVLMQHLYVSFWLGVIVAFPFIFWEFWKFVRPGLHDEEQKTVRGVVGVCSALFLLGVGFGYFVIAPFSINFLAGYTVEGTDVSPTLDSYVTYMTMFTIPTGLIFEMPVVIYFLAKIGLVGPNFLRTYRRHAIVIILIIAAIITPPDVVSQTIVSIPLFILYEVSILVAARIQKKRERELGLSTVREVEPK
ncbi:MAG: twin-arginine translocase subunit TatC [Thermoanaerobaculia bacterium]|nr:twin-arginine translocase subunit TatC [Thermoanaerobaculia bacterium]